MVLRACLGAGALALLLATSGCSDDPQPRVEPTADSPAPSPTETTSAEPAAWEVKSKAGVYAFLRHWVASLNEAAATGSVETLKSLNQEDCRSCNALSNYIADVYGSGGSIRGGEWQVVQQGDIASLATSPVASLRIRQGKQTVRHGPDAKPTTVPPTTQTVTFQLSWTGSWSVASLEIAA